MEEDPTREVAVLGATALQAVKGELPADEPEPLPPPAQPIIRLAKASATR